jgi:prepilin-type N-terminal cleavage/methylation domain-containing protein
MTQAPPHRAARSRAGGDAGCGVSCGAGFTLIELIVATVVLSVGLLALSALVHRLAGQLEDARRVVRLDLRARSALDSILALEPDRVETGLWRGDGSEVSIDEEDGLALRDLLVVMTDSAGAIPQADTLATRASAG